MAEFSVTFDDYAFPNLLTVRDNFRDSDASVTKTLNGDGGFDSNGADDGLSEVGRVDVTFFLESTATTGMQTLIDAANVIRYYGKRKLYLQPEGTAAQRWCWARVINMPIPRGPTAETNKKQSMSVAFLVNDPHWYENEGTATVVIGGTSTYGTITHNGNAPALARLVLQANSGGTVNAPVIQRLVGAVAYDEVSYSGTVTTAALTINAQSHSVTYGAADAYSSFDCEHPDWFRLYPGANTVRITAGTATGGTMTVYYYPTYR